MKCRWCEEQATQAGLCEGCNKARETCPECAGEICCFRKEIEKVPYIIPGRGKFIVLVEVEVCLCEVCTYEWTNADAEEARDEAVMAARVGKELELLRVENKELNERIVSLTKRVRQAAKKLNSYHRDAARQYRQDQDYISYPDEDKD